MRKQISSWVSAGLKVVGIVLVAYVSAVHTTLTLWVSMTDGLLAFLGLICAAVMQVTPLTANFLQGEVLKPEQVNRLSDQLQRQQDYWTALFVSGVLTALILVFSKAFSDVIIAAKPLDLYSFSLEPSRLIVFLIAFMVTFVFGKVFSIFTGLNSLAKARRAIALQQARDRVDLEIKIATDNFDNRIPNLPENYGSIIH